MKKKKATIKVMVAVFTTLIIVWMGMFITDFIRCNSLKSPIFVVASDNVADDGGSGTYNGLGYTVNIKKHISAQDGTILESVEMLFLDKVISASIQ